MTSDAARTVAIVRRAVRSVVEATPELRRDPELARTVAERMVGVSLAAADLIAEEQRLSGEIAGRSRRTPTRAPAPGLMARAQAAGDQHRRTAVDSAAGTLRATRDAIDFPGFVTSLISGVFQSIQNSSIQQLQAFAELLDAVNSSTSDFATSQISAERAAQWAANRFSSFAVQGSGDTVELTLRDDAEMPDAEELKRVLGASDEEVSTVDDSSLAETLLPIVRRKLARDRQTMLATMVLMGLQRVVVDDGAIHASMQLQVDARSTSEQRTQEQSDARVETEASGSFGVGAWGASAKLSASVGYVKSDDQFTREDIAISAGLRSSVDVRFRTVPLDTRRMASDRTLEQIRGRSMVPETERALAPGGLIAQEPQATTRGATLPTPAGPGSLIGQDRGTMGEARTARQDAARERAGTPPGAAAPGGQAGQATGGRQATQPSGGGQAGQATQPSGGGQAGQATQPSTGNPLARVGGASLGIAACPARCPPVERRLKRGSRAERSAHGYWGTPLPELERSRSA